MTTELPPEPTANPFVLRRALRPDAPALIELITALAQFEKLTQPIPEKQNGSIEVALGIGPRFRQCLASCQDHPPPVATAVSSEPSSPSPPPPTLYPENLFALPRIGGAESVRRF